MIRAHLSGFCVGLALSLPIPALAAAPTNRVTQTFGTRGIKRIIVRSHKVDRALISYVKDAKALSISATPMGDAKGYHSSDPDYKETPASQWGLKFASRRYGDTLVIAAVRELFYLHHYYYLNDLEIKVPSGIKLTIEVRKLDGDDGVAPPDLRKP